MSITLIVGANGTVGSELTRLLQANGLPLRLASSRQPETAAHVQVDLRTGAGLERAFDGVSRAFLLSPPGFADQEAILAPLIDLASQKLERVVLMTAMGADASDDLPFRKAELRLLRTGVSATIIRPNWFMQNFNTFWRPSIAKEARIRLPVGHARGSFIDARDIAQVAARLLTTSDYAGQAFDLTGPEALDHDEVAALLSSAIGRPISFEDVSPETMLANLLAAGLPTDYAKFLITILGYFKAGYSAKVTDSVENITGQPPRSFATYARDYWAG